MLPSILNCMLHNDRALLKHECISNAYYMAWQIVEKSSIFRDLTPIIYSHHERYDGNGYPMKLKGEDISFLARIVSVADAFDAMTSRRSYRDKLELDYVKDQIKQGAGSQFDPEVANKFLDILENKYEKIEEIMNKFPS